MKRLIHITHILSVIALTALSAAALFATFGLDAQTSAPESRPHSAAALPNPDPQALTLRVNDAPIPVQTILAFSDDKQALKLYLSSHPRACDDYRATARALAPGEQTLSLTLAPALQRRGFGSISWQITSLHHDAMSDRDLGSVTLSATDTAQHLRFGVDVQMHQPASDLLRQGPTSLTLQGDVTAHYCGARDR